MDVLIFGAGDGGLRVSQLLDSRFKIIAFIDDNTNKQGKTLNGNIIISRAEISNYEYDYLIISIYNSQVILNQLVDELMIPQEKIIDCFRNGLFDTRLASLKMVADEIYSNQVPGNTAELGVYKGNFAQKINELFRDRKLYLFDTFQGFNQTDIEIESKQNFSNANEGEYCNSDIDLVLHKMPFPQNCIVKKGYFPETTEGLEDKFAFVSIDVDLYKPTIEGLKYFYSRLSKGGYIFVHDYNSTRFYGVKEAIKNFCLKNDVKYFPIPDLCGSVIINK